VLEFNHVEAETSENKENLPGNEKTPLAKIFYKQVTLH